MTSFYFTSELQEAALEISQHNPHLANLINMVNGLMKDSPLKYAAFVRRKQVSSFFPFVKPKIERDYVLLYGEIDEHRAMVDEINIADPMSYLLGINDEMRRQRKQKAHPKEMWDKFIDKVDDVEDMETKNFLGSIEKYKRIFLSANE